MKNKEKFTKEIVDIACKGEAFAIEKSTGLPVRCTTLPCDECLFNGASSCRDGIKEWAESEYVELPVISKNDRRFLDCIGNTYKYIVRDKDGKLFVCKKVYTVNDECLLEGVLLAPITRILVVLTYSFQWLRLYLPLYGQSRI